MDASTSCRKVLILDCCYSGAFPAGPDGEGRRGVQTLERFQGKGGRRAHRLGRDPVRVRGRRPDGLGDVVGVHPAPRRGDPQRRGRTSTRTATSRSTSSTATCASGWWPRCRSSGRRSRRTSTGDPHRPQRALDAARVPAARHREPDRRPAAECGRGARAPAPGRQRRRPRPRWSAAGGAGRRRQPVGLGGGHGSAPADRTGARLQLRVRRRRRAPRPGRHRWRRSRSAARPCRTAVASTRPWTPLPRRRGAAPVQEGSPVRSPPPAVRAPRAGHRWDARRCAAAPGLLSARLSAVAVPRLRDHTTAQRVTDIGVPWQLVRRAAAAGRGSLAVLRATAAFASPAAWCGSARRLLDCSLIGYWADLHRDRRAGLVGALAGTVVLSSCVVVR